MNGWLKGGIIGALLLTLLWWLSPRPSEPNKAVEGAVEIHYMGPGGPIKDALEDAIREFEFVSHERYKIDPSYPIYKVISGQNASRDPVEDPTRFLLSLAGGMPPDVIMFDRFAISEWASRGVFHSMDDFIERDSERWNAWQQALEQNPEALPPWPGARDEPPRARGAEPLSAIEPVRREDYYPACWDETIFHSPRTGEAHCYGIPMNADDRVLLYNKDILVRYGYTNANGEAQPPRSWEELEEMANTHGGAG